MKYHLTIALLFFSISLFSQVKGVSPLNDNSPDKINQTYAVAVGISDYQDPDIPDLRFADKDAEAFAAFLQSPAGGSLDEDHLKVLINEQATAAQFAIALDWLWEVVQENDRVIIYFSGHGDVERKSITQPGYLLCWDAPARVYMAGGTFNVNVLNDVVSTLSLKNKAKVILVTDACRAGKLSGSDIGGAQATAANLAKQFTNEIKILSCQPDEYSIEGEQWGGGRGAFSYHLLDGLSGMADNDDDQSVNLKEIGRYLEDRITEEVAPQKQNPLVVGNRSEKLTDVFPEILAQLKEGKKGQLQLFTSTESRGIEDEVLAAADSNVVKLYFAFQKSLADKNFLCDSTEVCAEYYYEKLSREPQLKRLHSSMRRNYAAALQDDAQQVINAWLIGDTDELRLTQWDQSKKYQSYPVYLERAAKLLGKGHYMYPILKARNLYFEAYLKHIDLRNTNKQLGKEILALYHKSLEWQPDAAHVYHGIMWVYYCQMQQPDSAEYYAHRATELVPSWFMPYSNLGFLYSEIKTNPERSKYFLELADQIDPKSANVNGIHLMNWGVYYRKTQQYKAAIKKYNEGIQLDSTYYGNYNNLGNIYNHLRQYDEAEKYYKKAILLDSTDRLTQHNLGNTYASKRQFKKAKKQYRKAIQLDSTYADAYFSLGNAHNDLGEMEEAEKLFKKAIQLNSAYADAYNNLGNVYNETQQYQKAEDMYKKSLELDAGHWMALSNLGLVYHNLQRWEEAAAMTQKAIDLMPNDGGLLAELGHAYTHIPEWQSEAGPTLLKAKKMDPDWPDTYLYLAVYQMKNGQAEKAWQNLEIAFQKGLGKDGVMNQRDLQIKASFEPFRTDERWHKLMAKQFPESNNTPDE